MADDFEVALLLKAFHCFTTQAAVPGWGRGRERGLHVYAGIMCQKFKRGRRRRVDEKRKHAKHAKKRGGDKFA